MNDPQINLAIEVYCLKHLDHEQKYFIFYVTKQYIIICNIKNKI
ncbi:lipoate--protein ligase, partial [Bacillus vallismortis]|nr:lipoate--protein ligase [Bacillus vallismortis]